MSNALEASWPIGGAPSPRTLDDSSEGNHPISEDARRLLGREQLAAGESTGTCGVMANHTKSITQTLPVPKVCGDTGIRTTDHNRSKVNGTSLTTSPLVGWGGGGAGGGAAGCCWGWGWAWAAGSGTGWVVVQRTTRLAASTLQSPLSVQIPLKTAMGLLASLFC